jgi:hypothetical protein
MIQLMSVKMSEAQDDDCDRKSNRYVLVGGHRHVGRGADVLTGA